MIQVNNVGFSYPHATSASLNDISFQAKTGEAIALVGKDGCGKSTLLRLLSGFIPRLIKGKRSGEVKVAGLDPSKVKVAERMAAVGLLFANPANQLSGVCATVEEEIAWGMGNLGIKRKVMHERVAQIADRLHLTALLKRSPLAISLGQQQRVALASIMVLQPKVLLLDEPAASLDPSARLEVLRMACEYAETGHTVIWATPALEEAAAFKRWIHLEAGRIISDGPDSIPQQAGALEAPWTRIARMAQQEHKWSGPLPVTEAQALEGLRQAKR